ncbi:MAG: heat-inducible transcription repressor HrcA [Anaerolineae bacterium]|nr:MAG: heat-inducible transcription repressor HrcA [Anaerolineae bacterium]
MTPQEALTERQRLILALVIRYYVEHVEPVGSQRLVEHFGLRYSSATVRNEMAVLAERGYLQKPHKMAGSVPTEEGYRYFVSQLMGHASLPAETRHTIRHQFYQARHDIDEWMQLAASVLARQARAASLVTSLHPERARLKHLELIAIRGRQVLMVLVLEGGEIRQQMLKLSEPVPQQRLSVVAGWINEIAAQKDAEGVRALQARASDDLQRDVLKLIAAEMERSDKVLAGEIYRDGLANVLAEPEFAEPGVAHRALRFWEERSQLEELLAQTVLTPETSGVHVLIGGEGKWEDLSDCAVILSRYGVPGVATGALGVLGPTRMPYAHTISTVRYVANLMSELVSDTLAEDERYIEEL